MTYTPTAIDLSRVGVPPVIEVLDFEVMLSAAIDRFMVDYEAARVRDPSLPAYTVEMLQTDAVVVELRTWSNLRLYDRQRVNDAIDGLLAVRAKGGNLDTIVAGRNVERMTISPADGDAAAVTEGDAALLRRYLLSFDAPASGSAGRYLFDAWSAWPQSADKTLGLWDARVNGRAVHGRRGDTDVVVIGPAGRLPTELELTAVRAAVTDPNRAPEAVAISVMAATRSEYEVRLRIRLATGGAIAEIIRQEVIRRVTDAATARVLIGGEIPEGLLRGAAYGDGVIGVVDLDPVVIAADPYKVPVMTAIDVSIEVSP